ncbi:MAG: phospholipase D family protein [Pseudobdellovibrionaceae bacterium]
MKLVAGKVNRSFLDSYLENAKTRLNDIVEIKIAVAYADGDPKLLSWCLESKLKTTFYCRFDHTIPVNPRILEKFLKLRSPLYICKLVPELFHPKVIWWVGYGVYIGSANLTDNGWLHNIECGVFFTESELITNGMDTELRGFFTAVDENAMNLRQEIFDQIAEFEKHKKMVDAEFAGMIAEFKKKRLVPPNSSLIRQDERSRADKDRTKFLKEWNQTLQYLRDIAHRVSSDQYRPSWVKPDVPIGVQADQFLHAYYYNQVVDAENRRRHPFEEYFLKNSKDPELALIQAMTWWKSTTTPPSSEDQTMYEWYPILKPLLSEKMIRSQWTEADCIALASHVHAIRDHARKMDNVSLGVSGKDQKSQDECNELFGKFLSRQTSEQYLTLNQVLAFVLYGGSKEDAPNRLWDACTKSEYKLAHFGVSSIGEIIGWAFPEIHPPRNGRSSKALRALGYDVEVHSG